MASYGRIFESADVSTANEVFVRLADPPRTAPLPIVRPGVARYAGELLLLLDLSASSTFAAGSPVEGVVRRVTLDPATPLPNGETTLLEIVPRPFSTPPTHRGTPTFYIAPFEHAPVDDERVTLGQPITSASRVWIAARFQDSFCGSASDWVRAINESLPAEEQAAWLAQLSVFGASESLRVADHAGAPVPTAVFSIFAAARRRPYRRGRMGARGRRRVRRVGGGPRRAARRSGRHVHVALRAASRPPFRGAVDAGGCRIAGPRHHVGHSERLSVGPSAAPDVALPIAPGVPVRRTLQVLAIEDWFAASPEGAAVPMFRTNSRVEPLVDGTETFRRLAEDLDRARSGQENGQQLGAYFAGLKILDFPLVRGRDETKLTAYAKDILANDGSILVLPDKWLNLRDPNLEAIRTFAALLILSLTTIEVLVSAGKALKIDVEGAIFTFTAVSASVGITLLVGIPEDEIEPSSGTLAALNALLPPAPPSRRPIAIYARPPMRLDDNPLLRFRSCWDRERHRSCRLLAREGAARAAFRRARTGIARGLRRRRRRQWQSPGHAVASGRQHVPRRAGAPQRTDRRRRVHLVHRQVEVAAAEHERLTEAAGAAETPALPGFHPTSENLQPTGAETAAHRHVARIGRTYYRPKPGDASPLDFARRASAPSTTRCCWRSRRRSSTSTSRTSTARRTTNSSTRSSPRPPDAVARGHDPHRERSVLRRPQAPDDRRPPRRPDRLGRSVLHRLSDASAGAGRGRPLHREGRCVLAQEASPSDDFVVLSPPARVPKMPAWLWIDGELMLARRAENTTVDGKPAMRVTVVREAAGRLKMGTKARPTLRSAGDVLVAEGHLRARQVHDDRRRVRLDWIDEPESPRLLPRRRAERLRDPRGTAIRRRQPARALRTALWAEQLGLPPVMGSLLGDVASAYDLFLRSRFITRAVPYDAVDVKAELGFLGSFEALPSSLLKILESCRQAGRHRHGGGTPRCRWDVAVDPTSFIDPNPQPGPFL
jgi:hypothetical protein